MNEQWVKLFWNSLKCNPELYLGSNSDVPDREGPTMTFFRWIGFSSDSLNSVNWTVSGLQAVRWSCKVRCGNLISVFFFFFFFFSLYFCPNFLPRSLFFFFFSCTMHIGNQKTNLGGCSSTLWLYVE